MWFKQIHVKWLETIGKSGCKQNVEESFFGDVITKAQSTYFTEGKAVTDRGHTNFQALKIIILLERLYILRMSS